MSLLLSIVLKFYCLSNHLTLCFTVPKETEEDNSFGDFLSSPPASQSQQPTNQIAASVLGTNQIAASISVPNQNQGSTPPRKQTKVDPPKKGKND